MAKEKPKDAEGKARQKLAEARTKLRSAEEKRRRIIAKGEAQLERVRKKSAEAVAEVTARVEERAAAVAKAEARLLALRRDEPAPAPSNGPSDADLGIVPASPVKAADRLEAIEASAEGAPDGTSAPAIEVPESTTDHGV